MTLDDLNTRIEGQYPLTSLQFAFCSAYASHGNGMRAVREAGYTHSTPGAQSSAAYRLLRQDKIKKAVEIIREST